MSNVTNRDPAAALAGLRTQIDAIDDELVRLLTQRSQIVSQVKTLKDAHWPSACHVRPGREGAMHAAMFARFKDTLLGAQAGAEIWRLFISAHTMIESQLKITALPETMTLAQTYFSPLAEYETVGDIEQIATVLTTGRAEIACVPCTVDMAAIIAAVPDARIFAYAPLVLKNARTPEAWFIGIVTPEPSGDDLSYFLSHGKITSVAGYHETHPADASAQFIGAHATPLHLE